MPYILQHDWATFERIEGCNDIESKARALPRKSPSDRDEIARSIRAACGMLSFPWLTATQIDNQIHSPRTSPEVKEAMIDLKARILLQETDDSYSGTADLAWDYLRHGVCAGRLLSADPEKVADTVVNRHRQGYISLRRLRQFINVSDDLHCRVARTAPVGVAQDRLEWEETAQGRTAMQAARDNARAVEMLYSIERHWRLIMGPAAMGYTDDQVLELLIAVEPTNPILVKTTL